jgi:hypothetical protein
MVGGDLLGKAGLTVWTSRTARAQTKWAKSERNATEIKDPKSDFKFIRKVRGMI